LSLQGTLYRSVGKIWLFCKV